MTKEQFQQWLWKLSVDEICHLHSDNEIFNAELFVDDCKNKFQTQSFSGVGAHHQNEQSIQTIMYMDMTFIIHVSLHWSKYGAEDLGLCGFAVKHAVLLHNCIPNCLSGLTQFELFAKTKANNCDLLFIHVWG